MSGIAPWLMGMGCIGCAIAGFLIGRNALKTSIEKRVKKEIYEQGKIDGACEFVRNSIFAGVPKR